MLLSCDELLTSSRLNVSLGSAGLSCDFGFFTGIDGYSDMARYSYSLLALVFAGMVFLAISCGPGVQPTGPGEALSEEFETLNRQIADANRSPKTRFEAAWLLLGKRNPRVNDALRKYLGDSSNPGAQLAVARAITMLGSADESFVPPLLKMLTGEEPSVRQAGANALVTYKSPAVARELIAIARGQNRDVAVRVATIDALHRVVTKRYIQTLIDLLTDPVPAVRLASAESLARLTNIRTFGADARRWQTWWGINRDKTQVQWLAALAQSLTRSRSALETQNAMLRDRLVKAKQNIYDATGEEQKQAILLEMLKDSISDIRLLGITLIDRRVAANQPIEPKLAQSVGTLLDDEDPRIRQAVAMLKANLAEPGTAEVLLRRLGVELRPAVRVGLLTALGQLKAPQARQAVQAAISSKDVAQARAGAGALARIAEALPLAGKEQNAAARVLQERYAQAVASQNAQELREALLRAMGVVGDASISGTLVKALKDPAGVIRLAAVNGLARLQAKDAANEIASLAGDPDRGVRQAVITALISLGGDKFLKTILQRTDPQVEPDQAVRKQALEGVLAHCQRADAATLETILKLLNSPSEADDSHVRILSLYVAALRRENPKSAKLPGALQALGDALSLAGRADEAAAVLEELYNLTLADKSKAGLARTRKVWLAYVRALLQANNPAVAQALAKQADPAAYNQALLLLLARVDTLLKDPSDPSKKTAATILIQAALKELPKKLSAKRKAKLQEQLEDH